MTPEPENKDVSLAKVFLDEFPPLQLSENARRLCRGLNMRLVSYSDPAIDDYMVEWAAARMKEKMASARKKGRGGWHTPNCTTEELRQKLREHIDKGDMVDVLNLAGMILLREHIGYND